MAAADTRTRILDAAERLFAEQGFDATSLRQVTAAAGTNLAAVNYHFGAKAALLPAVVARIIEPVSVRQRERLEELEASTTAPTVEELVEAFVTPITELFAQRDRGPTLARMFARILGDPGAHMRQMMTGETQYTAERYEGAFAQLLPRLSREELWWRVRTMPPVVVLRQIRMQAPAELGGPPTAQETDPVAQHEWTVTFLVGALQAPASATAGRRGPGAKLSPV